MEVNVTGFRKSWHQCPTHHIFFSARTMWDHSWRIHEPVDAWRNRSSHLGLRHVGCIFALPWHSREHMGRWRHGSHHRVQPLHQHCVIECPPCGPQFPQLLQLVIDGSWLPRSPVNTASAWRCPTQRSRKGDAESRFISLEQGEEGQRTHRVNWPAGRSWHFPAAAYSRMSELRQLQLSLHLLAMQQGLDRVGPRQGLRQNGTKIYCLG